MDGRNLIEIAKGPLFVNVILRGSEPRGMICIRQAIDKGLRAPASYTWYK